MASKQKSPLTVPDFYERIGMMRWCCRTRKLELHTDVGCSKRTGWDCTEDREAEPPSLPPEGWDKPGTCTWKKKAEKSRRFDNSDHGSKPRNAI